MILFAGATIKHTGMRALPPAPELNGLLKEPAPQNEVIAVRTALNDDAHVCNGGGSTRRN